MPISQITASSIADGTVIASDIADGTITAAKLAPGAALPSQTGNGTYYLTSDGSNAIWKAQTQLTIANTQVTGVVAVSQGGTGQSSFTNGQLLVGNTTSGGLDKTTLTAGTGTAITNAAGSITIAPASGYNGFGARTVSTSSPTGGSDGDIWYKY